MSAETFVTCCIFWHKTFPVCCTRLCGQFYSFSEASSEAPSDMYVEGTGSIVIFFSSEFLLWPLLLRHIHPLHLFCSFYIYLHTGEASQFRYFICCLNLSRKINQGEKKKRKIWWDWKGRKHKIRFIAFHLFFFSFHLNLGVLICKRPQFNPPESCNTTEYYSRNPQVPRKRAPPHFPHGPKVKL